MRRLGLIAAAALGVASCGGSMLARGAGPTAHAAGPNAHAAGPTARAAADWRALQPVPGVVDLSAPRRDGALIVAAAGRLWLRTPNDTVKPFAPHYGAPPGLEPYIALSSGQRVKACRFPVGAVYALRLTHGNGVTMIAPTGRVAKFAALPRQGLENGIAFDQIGRFGHRLLVTASAHGKTAVFAIDCRGHVQVLSRRGPRVEGGIAVAPGSFGRFGGDLIAPDEISGRIYAISPDGHASLVVQSGIPHGQDLGVESEGFVPAGYSRAVVADRLTPGNPHPGDNLILALTHVTLTSLGVHAGDLLAVSEGGARTVVVTCTRHRCRARLIALGPARAHVEGHVSFLAGS